jgi:nickel transport protein
MPRRAGLPRAAVGAAMLTAIATAAPIGAAAHQLVVFASVDCEAVMVEAKFSSGRIAQKGEVRVLDGDNALQTSLELGSDGTARIPLDTVDHSGGLVIEVDTGSHDNYWIVTPEDIALECGS